MKSCIIIPIKHNSTRVPGKNYRDFNGLPLMKIILNTILETKLIDTIVIDTNSDLVKEILSNYQDDRIIIYDRPEHLWPGDTPTNVLLENVIQDLNLNHEIILQTHVTNPLLKVSTIENCINLFLEKEKEGYDSLFTVKQLQTRLYTLENDVVNALNHNPNELIPTQDLEPLYEENSCLYIFKREILFKKHHRIGYKPYMYVMNDIESSDIDTETDFILAETLHKELVLNENNQKRVVLVTGASRGIGLEICKKFHKNKWIVIGVARSPDFSDASITTYISKDLTNVNAAKEIIKEIEEKHGRLDCIVNNAALQICKPVWEMDENDWSKTFDCNVKNIYLFVKYGLSMLKETQGNIINIGSVHSVCTSNEIAAYATTKAAITGLTRNLAIELSPFKIRVNCICPGAVDTPMLRDGLLRGHAGSGTSDELVDSLAKSHLLGKVGQPYEIANFVEFVANDENGKFINGANLLIDGGACIKLSTE
jgi:NAD(P)-dependent dehydrogenase (short-subunit alcohol dehydrogenase family)/CMP-N-acetylneuraminic acid synthetase